MKKTLIITLEFPPTTGGVATYVDQLASALDATSVVVLAPKMLETESFDNSLKYKVIRRDLFYKLFWPRWIKLYFAAKDIVKTYGIERVIIHHVLPVGYIGWLLHKFYQIPYIVFSHGTDIVAASKSNWKKKMANMVLEKSAQIIFNSENLKKRFLERFPNHQNKAVVMYPCPDKEFAIPPTSEDLELLRHKLALEGKKVILTVARIDDGKGYPHLVKVMPKVLEKIPNLVWIIIGTGPMRDVIYKEIEKEHLQNVVRYLGEIKHSDIKKYYYFADLFVLFTHPERDGREEGLGLAFLEAAASGKAVVAGKSGGVEEGVINGQTGVIVDVLGNIEESWKTIVDLVQNPDQAKKLGDQAKQRINEEFIWEKQLKVLEPWIN